MTDTQYLDSYFNCFPAYFEDTWHSHRKHFQDLIAYKRLDRNGINSALRSGMIDWKDRAYWGDFFLFDESKTSEDIKVDYMLLTWDILFPEKMLSSEQLAALKSKIIVLLEQGNTTGNHSFHIDDLILELEEQGWSGLSRFDLLYMQREIGLPEIEMEYFVPELWFFKLRSKPTPATSF